MLRWMTHSNHLVALLLVLVAIGMAGRRGPQATYDQMMAEIQMESEDEEDQTPRPQTKRESGRGGRRPASPPPARHHERRYEGSDEEDKAVGNSCTTSREKDQRKEGKHATQEASSSAASKDADSQRRRIPFPPSSSEKSRTQRRSNNSGGDASSDSDNSDHEREAPVVNANRELFGAAGVAQDGAALSGTPRRIDIEALRAFVMRAPSRGAAAIRCYVERDRQGLNRLHPVFRLFLESGQQFLLCAQKRATSKTANYLLTLEQHPTNRRSALVVGKLRSNWSGSEYTVFDDGLSPSKTALEANARNVLTTVEFSYDEMGPGRLVARIPQVQPNGAAAPWKEDQAAGSSLAQQKELLLLRNKRPHYDEKTGGHVLDFGGRVTMLSIKNFQMQADNHGDDSVLQFGRVSCQPSGPRVQCKCHKHTFTMDVKHPLSPLQGFAICLATLDSKFTDTKLYDNMSKLIKRK